MPRKGYDMHSIQTGYHAAPSEGGCGYYRLFHLRPTRLDEI